jgi:hypothetical protein
METKGSIWISKIYSPCKTILLRKDILTHVQHIILVQKDILTM